jgi:hypothetical protein
MNLKKKELSLKSSFHCLLIRAVPGDELPPDKSFLGTAPSHDRKFPLLLIT